MTIDASLNDRLRRVVRKHERMRTNGVVRKVGRDGLIRTRPRLIRPQFPLKGALAVVVLFVLFKSFMIAQLGSASFDQRVDTLRAGTLVDQMGAVLMQPDPLTTKLAVYIKEYL